MTELAQGAFDVTISPEESHDRIGRFVITKTWTGDLAGRGHGEMLSAGDPASGSAGYVALELVDGTLHGRRGSLAFQQLGVMDDGEQRLEYVVVPGSGAGELVGITGRLALTIDDRGHTYELTYSLP